MVLGYPKHPVSPETGRLPMLPRSRLSVALAGSTGGALLAAVLLVFTGAPS